MPTYDQLNTEAVWKAEVEAPANKAFNERLRAHYGMSRSQIASKGDNHHLSGRHRSRNWTKTSQFATSRTYGAVDARDKAGDGDWLRATDIGLTGAALRAASARVDAAVRAGQLPELAEWFGTTDGKHVVGWYEGHPSSSDDSHLYHLHLGWWTKFSDDAWFFERLYAVVTGTGDAEDDMQLDDVVYTETRPDGTKVERSVGDILRVLMVRTDFVNNTWIPAFGKEIRASLAAILQEASDDPATTVTMTDADRDALAARLVEAIKLPSLEQMADAVADETADRLRQ